MSNKVGYRDYYFPGVAGGPGAVGGVPIRLVDNGDGTYSECPMSNGGAAYKACASVTLAAPATDVSVIGGSATKIIQVLGVQISGTQTGGSEVEIFLVKRSAADTLGTPVAMTAVPLDSNDAAATASVNMYTANPTVGTPVGNVARRAVPLGAPAGTIQPPTYISFHDKGKPVVLRGTAQQLALNLNGVTLAGGLMDVEWEWIEL